MRWRTLFLDLDDTLYPGSSGVWQAIGDRIQGYMVERLRIPAERAARLRADYLRDYGTTLNGLRANFGADPRDYLAYVHDVPVEQMLQPDPQLEAMLAGLSQKRVVFTNANRDHAERVLRRLGVRGQVDLVIDIFDLAMKNKPEPEAYAMALALAGEGDPTACVIVDDTLRNLLAAGSLGMTTVLVGGNDEGAPVDRRIQRITELTAALPELQAPPDGGQAGR